MPKYGGPLRPAYDVAVTRGAPDVGTTPGVIPLRVTINQGGSQDDPAETSPIVFNVGFSEAVTGFATGDVTLSGTAGGTLVGTVVNSGDDINFTVTVTGMTSPGTVTATVAAGVATAVATGNTNYASTSTDNTVTWSPLPPGSLTMVGTPYTSLNIPYFGDFDLATQHLIVGDVGNATVYIIDCSTDNPSLVGSAFAPAGYWTARWGVTNATAFYFSYNAFGPTFHGLWPVDTASHAAPSIGTLVAQAGIYDFFRHGARLLANDFSNALYRYTISAGIPTQTGSLAAAAGAGWGHPNDPDTVFICRGASLLSLDISGANPTIRQTFTPGGGFNAGHCVAAGDTLYVLGSGKFHMVDITNPNSLSLMGTLTNSNLDGGGAICVEPNGLYAYTTNGAAGATKRIDAIDCRNPASIAILTTWSASSNLANPMDIFYDSTGGDRLIVISQQPKIQVFSITR